MQLLKIKTAIIVSFFIIVFFGQMAFAQQSTSISDLTANATEASAELETIFDLDVFRYYNLEGYDTELKQSVYKKTTEYQNYLLELKAKKVEMLKSNYYTIQTEMFSSINYDVSRKGFEIELGTNTGMGTASARTPKSIYLQNGGSIVLKGLPSKQKSAPILGQGILVENLFLSMSEENGLEIENNKDDVQIYYFFTPTGREKSVFKYYNYASGQFRGWYNITNNDLKSDKVRIVVANKTTGAIYYDKSYNYQPPIKKK